MLMQATLPQDPSFPCLVDALDPELAARAFADAFAQSGCPVIDLTCSVERVRVKRRTKVVIGYALTGVDRHGHPFNQQAMVSLWPSGDQTRLKDMGGHLVETHFGPPKAMLERIGGTAWLFPNDRKVHHISDLLCGPTGSSGGTAEVIHYVPEQGCTVRYTHQGRTVFGKTRADERCAVAALIDQSAQENGNIAVRLARVIEHDPKRRILWQEEVPGEVLNPADVLARPALWAPRIARTLAAFHSIHAPRTLKSLTSQSIARTLRQRAGRTIQFMPELAVKISSISRALEGACPDTYCFSVSHCDLHPGNLLWDGVSFALIDLDTAALAPSARDYGSLIAALIHKAIEAQATDDAILNMVDAFRVAAPDVPHIGWFTAASLIGERLYRCGTRLKSPSLEARSRLITLAQTVLEDHRG
jgi:thiamine kinase-like enzyme